MPIWLDNALIITGAMMLVAAAAMACWLRVTSGRHPTRGVPGKR